MTIENAKSKFKEIVRQYEIGVIAGYIEKGSPARTSKIDGAWEILRSIGIPHAQIESLVDEAKLEAAAMVNP